MMKRKLSIVLLTALLAAFAGTGSALALEPDDSVHTNTKGKDNLTPPSILPPQV
ncbi:hypothetical protein M3193_11175 [Sporosarcina luteola]|uniref:hypothetical protein n=1 Tax=Sporosarcina luteola TaxID=582850 RepID=UPI00203B3AB2|nr:hypothetical protein [Sporosarcina luteola]MCM3744708.1 hypothetical protein [Sporosarcina luteola]